MLVYFPKKASVPLASCPMSLQKKCPPKLPSGSPRLLVGDEKPVLPAAFSTGIARTEHAL